MSDPVKCEVCGTPKGEPHPFIHTFQEPGQDVKLEAPKKQESTPKQVKVGSTSEGLLIGLMQTLVAKGVLDGDDIARILTGAPPGAAADRRENREPGPTQAAG